MELKGHHSAPLVHRDLKGHEALTGEAGPSTMVAGKALR